jgi:16S rRNA G966 N2-methylase RsmD
MISKYFHHSYVSKWTLDDKPLKNWLIKKLQAGTILNLFAGKNKLRTDEIRVDISNEFKPKYNEGAITFLNNGGKKYDFRNIVLDPPYNLRKAMEKYNGNYFSKWKKIVNALGPYLNTGVLIFTFAYNSNGMREYYKGIELLEIWLVQYPGEINDIIVTMERVKQNKLSRYLKLND